MWGIKTTELLELSIRVRHSPVFTGVVYAKEVIWIPACAGMTEGLDSREACARESGNGNDDLFKVKDLTPFSSPFPSSNVETQPLFSYMPPV
jgi:hypothetical protein